MRLLSSRLRATVATLALLLANGCGDATGPVDPTRLTFAPFLGIDLTQMTRTSSGLYWRDDAAGSGLLSEHGDRVVVHYEGWLHNGTLFGSSHGSGVPFAVDPVGAANVIAGWNEGLIGVRPGTIRWLVIPSHLGYGARPTGPIPAHSTLVFRIDVQSVTR